MLIADSNTMIRLLVRINIPIVHQCFHAPRSPHNCNDHAVECLKKIN